MRFLRAATVVVIVGAAGLAVGSVAFGADRSTSVFIIIVAIGLIAFWISGTRKYFARIKPYHAQLGLSDGPAGSKTAAPAEDPYLAADKEKAAEVARTLKGAAEIPAVSPGLPLDDGEVCYRAISASHTREVVGALPILDDGRLLLTGGRLLYVSQGTQTSIPLKDITTIGIAGARAFHLRRRGVDSLETFDVEYPREFLAYMGIVSHRAGIKLPRITNR